MNAAQRIVGLVLIASGACTTGESQDAEVEVELECAEDNGLYCTCTPEADEQDISGEIVEDCQASPDTLCCYDQRSLQVCYCAPKCSGSADGLGCGCGLTQAYGAPPLETCAGPRCCRDNEGLFCICSDTTSCLGGETEVESCEPLDDNVICGGDFQPVSACSEAPWREPEPIDDDPGFEPTPECSSDSDCSGCARCSSGSCSACSVGPVSGECNC